jgi:hypothetical protein
MLELGRCQKSTCPNGRISAFLRPSHTYHAGVATPITSVVNIRLTAAPARMNAPAGYGGYDTRFFHTAVIPIMLGFLIPKSKSS